MCNFIELLGLIWKYLAFPNTHFPLNLPTTTSWGPYFAIVENEFFLYLTLKYVFVGCFFSLLKKIYLYANDFIFFGGDFLAILWIFLGNKNHTYMVYK